MIQTLNGEIPHENNGKTILTLLGNELADEKIRETILALLRLKNLGDQYPRNIDRDYSLSANRLRELIVIKSNARAADKLIDKILFYQLRDNLSGSALIVEVMGSISVLIRTPPYVAYQNSTESLNSSELSKESFRAILQEVADYISGESSYLEFAKL
jgi:hypothetical protein